MTIEDFEKANKIRQEMDNYRKRLRTWQGDMEMAKKNYAAEEVAIQKRCSHWFTKYRGDPSGNNDSHTECLICGAEVL